MGAVNPGPQYPHFSVSTSTCCNNLGGSNIMGLADSSVSTLKGYSVQLKFGCKQRDTAVVVV